MSPNVTGEVQQMPPEPTANRLTWMLVASLLGVVGWGVATWAVSTSTAASARQRDIEELRRIQDGHEKEDAVKFTTLQADVGFIKAWVQEQREAAKKGSRR